MYAPTEMTNPITAMPPIAILFFLSSLRALYLSLRVTGDVVFGVVV